MKLTRSEVETIRIHMNAFKEKLCNQGRWTEAQEYQDIVDKLDRLLTAEEERMTYWLCKEVLTDNGGYFEPVRKITMCQDCWCWNEE